MGKEIVNYYMRHPLHVTDPLQKNTCNINVVTPVTDVTLIFKSLHLIYDAIWHKWATCDVHI